MSFQLPTQRHSAAAQTRWSGAAFLIEAMLLLVFVMASLAVFTQMFAASTERANQSRALTDAVAVASTQAERFSADPVNGEADEWQGDLHLKCAVTPETRDGGTLYHADITVFREGGGSEPVYILSTSKYVEGV